MPDALKMLHEDHEKVSDEFAKAIASDDASTKKKHFDSLASDLEIHAALEEEIFYPEVQSATGRESLIRDSLQDHHRVKLMVSELRLLEPGEPEFDVLLRQLRHSVEAHVSEEENEVFPAAKQALGSRIGDIGSSMGKRKAQLKMAPPLTKAIDVDLPAHTVYEHWTHFEEFPRFMEGVEEVTRSDGTLHWRAKVGGQVEEWDAHIDEVDPDHRIEWHSISGTPQAGRVSFRELAPNRTRVLLEMVYRPQGAMENMGAALGVLSSQVEGNLRRFKQVAESRQRPTI